MSLFTAEPKVQETSWEEAVSLRSAVAQRNRERDENLSAERVMRYFATRDAAEPEAREWAAALKKPMEAALDDLRHDPLRAANLLAPMMEEATRLVRQRKQARRVEEIGKWYVAMTRPQMWLWAMKALWEGDSVWHYIQDRAQWHEVPELVLFDQRHHVVLARAESHSNRLRPGEPRLEAMSWPALQASEAEVHEPGPAVEPALEVAEEVPMAAQIVVVVGWRCKLAARVRGQAPADLRAKLQALCEEAETLLSFSPHPDMVHRLLERGLVCQVETSRPRTWVLVTGAVAAAVMVCWMALHEYRWHQLIATLDKEPGVKVLEQDTSWGRREISGLRDPLARNPQDIARALGLSPRDVAMDFKPFVSAEEPFISQRRQGREAPLPVEIVPRDSSDPPFSRP